MMTNTQTIGQLTDTIAAQYEIPTDAARDLVTTYVNQISDDADLWDADAEMLSADGAEVVTTAIATAYEHDLNSTAEDQMLADLEENRGKAVALAGQILVLNERRDELVRALMGTSVARSRIAEAAGVKEPRLYQIRDGRR